MGSSICYICALGELKQWRGWKPRARLGCWAWWVSSGLQWQRVENGDVTKTLRWCFKLKVVGNNKQRRLRCRWTERLYPRVYRSRTPRNEHYHRAVYTNYIHMHAQKHLSLSHSRNVKETYIKETLNVDPIHLMGLKPHSNWESQDKTKSN